MDAFSDARDFWKWKKAIEAKLSNIERRVTALEGKKSKEKKARAAADPIDDLVAGIADDAVEELNAEEEEFRGEILQHPHQFKKLASTESENKSINAFFADPIKVKYFGTRSASRSITALACALASFTRAKSVK